MSDDERTARADAAAAKARAKALRPWYQRKRWWAAGAVALIALIAVLAGGGDDGTDVAADDTDSPPASAAESPGTTDTEPEAEATTTTRDVDTQSGNTENPPPDDVAVTDCRVQELVNWMQTELTITNHSSRRSNYFIQTVYESEDGARQFGEGLAAVQNLEPGQTRVVEDASASEAPDEPFVCRVAVVDRMAS